MKEIILASGSPRRRELLTQIGIPYTVMISEADETITETEPGKIVEELSLRKAQAVAENVEEGIVLGADTIVYNDGHVLGKPADREDAAQMVRSLQGHAHSVFTGVSLIKKEKGETKISTFHRETIVHVHTMTEEEIENYMETGEALDKAGAYGIQGAFAAYVDGIEGDYQTVVGLPISAVYQELRKMQED